MLAEAKTLSHSFVPHRESDYRHTGWESLTIHGISSTHTEWHGAYGYNSPEEVPYRWTNIAPFTQEWFQSHWPIPTQKFYRIRFMKLKPGGYIDWHRDKPTTGYLGPINMALHNPIGCVFNIGDDESSLGREVVPFTNGSAFQIDIGYQHNVVNLSNEDRYHIIVHYVPR